MVLWSQKHPSRGVLKRKIHYPFKWIQLIEWSNHLNISSRLHLSNKLKECSKFLWIRFWNLCFISMKESIFSKVTKLKFFISIFIGFAKSVSYLALWASRNNFFYNTSYPVDTRRHCNVIRRLYDDKVSCRQM